MAMSYYPIHVSHVLIALIWASALIGINALEFLYTTISTTGLFFIVMQNIGIAAANSYWLVKTHITPSGLETTTTKP